MKSTPAIESEATIIGAFILDSSLFELVKDKLCPTDFYEPMHQVIFEAMSALYKKHGCFDAAMLVDAIKPEISYVVYKLSSECCSTANVAAHADIIREKSVQRQLIEAAKEIEKEKLHSV